MIKFRYLLSEIFTCLVAVTVILVLIFLSNQLIRYLGNAAEGRLLSAFLLRLLSLEIPNLFALLLPLGLFISILLTYGRLYADNELLVLHACGFSRAQLLAITVSFAVVIASLIALLTLWVSPHLMAAKEQLFLQSQGSMLSAILPGRFRSFDHGRRVLYVENSARSGKQVENVFMAEQREVAGQERSVFLAKKGQLVFDPRNGNEYIVTEQGSRYQGTPGQTNYNMIEYAKYGVLIDKRQAVSIDEYNTLPTAVIWQKAQQRDRQASAELQWRCSIPVSAVVLAVLAVAFSRAKPRQSRYANLLPATLVYIFYADMLFVARAWVAEGTISAQIGMGWIHLIIVLIAVALLWQPSSGYAIIQFFSRSKEARQ